MAGVSIDHNTWVMVGDGEKALFFRNEGDATYPNLEVVDVLEQENPKTGDQGTDRPGRAFASVGRTARAPTPGLPSPPMIMGDLRKAFHKEVSAKVVAEVSKDLTNMPAHEIERILAGNANSGA